MLIIEHLGSTEKLGGGVKTVPYGATAQQSRSWSWDCICSEGLLSALLTWFQSDGIYLITHIDFNIFFMTTNAVCVHCNMYEFKAENLGDNKDRSFVFLLLLKNVVF